jgi:hypothetical protein
MSNYTIPVLPPGSIRLNNTPGSSNIITSGSSNYDPSRGYSSTIAIDGSSNYDPKRYSTIAIGTTTTTYPGNIIGAGYSIPRNLIMGGKYVDVKGNNTTVISACNRPFEADEDASGTLFLRADKGVMIETTTPGEFINASEELEKIDDILDELREIKDMLHDMYWAPPNGPGYLKSKMNFDNLKDENQVPKSVETPSNIPSSISTSIPSSISTSIPSSSPLTSIASSSQSTNTANRVVGYSTLSDNGSYSVRGCNIQ